MPRTHPFASGPTFDATSSLGGRSLPNLRRAFCLVLCLSWVFIAFAQPSTPTPADSTEDATSPPAQTVDDGAADDARGSSEDPNPEQDPDSPATSASAASAGKVVYGRIDDDINLSTSAFIKRLVDEATEVEADVLLIDLNTFGGRIDAAVAIRDALLDAPMKTAVFINKRAISAGALISYACHTIAISPGGTIGAAMPVSGNPGQEIPEAVQEKYLSYFREEMRATAETRGRDPDIAEAMVDSDKVVEDVSEEGKLLTLGTADAVRLKVADLEAKDVDEVLAYLGMSEQNVVQVERSWSEELAAFLTSQAIASLLLLGMMLFGYLELQTPGFGFFGAAAAICFLLLYFSHYLTNLAGHEELLLFALGLMFLAVELLVLPGIGVFAILGTVSILASVILVISAGDWSDFSFNNPITYDAVQQVALVVLASFVGLFLMVRYIAPVKSTSTQGGLLLRETLSAGAGYTSFEDQEEELVGARGTALTQLRPSGKARFDGQRLSVETEGEWIDKDADVVIVRRSEGRWIVRSS